MVDPRTNRPYSCLYKQTTAVAEQARRGSWGELSWKKSGRKGGQLGFVKYWM